jgi:predicted component of type VI protein secretion system
VIDQLRQAIDHLQHLESASEDEQRVLAQRIETLIEEYEDELKWSKLFNDPRSEQLLNKLAAEADADIKAGKTWPIEQLFDES